MATGTGFRSSKACILKTVPRACPWVSTERNPVVTARCRKLQIACWQGAADGEAKASILQRFTRERGFRRGEVAYMGDDLNDMKVFASVGLAIAVADAHHAVKKLCKLITHARGGEHAVREICELLLAARGIKMEI